MTKTIDDYQVKLIDNILLSATQEEVKMHIDNTMKTMQELEINVQLISVFADNMIGRLREFNVLVQNAQEWTNIKMARIQFNKM